MVLRVLNFNSCSIFYTDDIVIVLNSSCLLPSHSRVLLPLSDHVNLLYTDQMLFLSEALNYGLSNCRHDIVFRFDPDDIIINNRFLVQYNFMLNNPAIDICGSFAYSFLDDSQETSLISLPCLHNDISSKYT